MEISERAYDFSERVAELVRYLKAERKEFPLTGKLLDCGVGAGLAAREGKHRSAAEHIKAADYIIEMAARAGYLREAQAKPIRSEAKLLLDALSSS